MQSDQHRIHLVGLSMHKICWPITLYYSHPFLCFLEKTPSNPLPPQELHNEKIETALRQLKDQQESYVIRDREGLILVEQGKFYGMSQSTEWQADESLEQVRQKITPYPENEMIKTLLRRLRESRPEQFYSVQ